MNVVKKKKDKKKRISEKIVIKEDIVVKLFGDGATRDNIFGPWLIVNWNTMKAYHGDPEYKKRIENGEFLVVEHWNEDYKDFCQIHKLEIITRAPTEAEIVKRDL